MPPEDPKQPGEIKPMESVDNRRPNGTFGPGNIANPLGRPAGSYSIMTLIKKKMEEIPVGQVKQWKEQIADIILDEAIVKRNPKMLEMIVEYMDGKPKQTVEMDVNRENVDSLTDLLRQMSTTKKPDGSDTTTIPPAGPGQ